MPLEGGLYQWAKLRWGEMAGFLVAWNLWWYAVLLISEYGTVTANNLAYALGPSMAWLAESKAVVIAISCLFSMGPMLVAVRGLGLGKWFQNIGSITLMPTTHPQSSSTQVVRCKIVPCYTPFDPCRSVAGERSVVRSITEI